MSDDLTQLVKQHHAFYEVSPYYIAFEERPVGLPAKTRRVQAGFNVDVYGVRTEDNEPVMPEPHEYALAYAELQRIAEKVSQRTTDSCSVDVIPFPSVAIIDARAHGQVEAMLRIRVSHFRGLDQPAGPAEERALEEVERELKSLGIAHR
jgi:hypothetical protein